MTLRRSSADAALGRAIRAGTLDAVCRPGAFDAVVVGAGATGGLAALLLVESGMRVLVLDAGKPRSFPGALRRVLRRGVESLLRSPHTLERRRKRQPIQSRCYAWEMDPDAFVDDVELPFDTPPGKPFVWIRSRQLGGRMVVPGHGRQYYRMGPSDLAPSDGRSPVWPVTYEELAPWYAHVENRLSMSGGCEGVSWLPDSAISNVLVPSESESWIQERVGEAWPHAPVVMGRFAQPGDFLEQAAETGRLTVRQGAVARELDVGEGPHIRGVRWVDHRSGTTEHVSAPLVFLCASALESTRLLLLSKPTDSPEGVGAASGALGRNLMDHVRTLAVGEGPALPPSAVAHRRCLYVPRFDSRDSEGPPTGRGFGVQVNHGPSQGRDRTTFSLSAYGEMLPRPGNRVTIHPTLRDAWGIPALHIDCAHGPEERAMAEAERAGLSELAGVLGVEIQRMDSAPAPPGIANHECGTARMGDSPADSVLDSHNQCWEAPGLYVVDGAALPSQACQNPTSTFLALTARACAHAVGGAPAPKPPSRLRDSGDSVSG